MKGRRGQTRKTGASKRDLGPQPSGELSGKGAIPAVTLGHPESSLASGDDYWEEMLGISRGPRGWNFSCG